jgi:uncharacterized protein (TIRG00374 family)
MKKRFLFLLKIAVSLALLIFLLRRIDFGSLYAVLSRAYVPYLAVAFVVLLGQAALSSLKWKTILRSDEVHAPFLYVFRTYLIGNFLSLFLPTSFGGDVYRILALKKFDENVFKRTSSVIFDRLTGIFALASISIISYAVFFRQGVHIPTLLAYAVAVLLFLIIASERTLVALAARESRISRWFAQALNSFVQYRKDRNTLIVVLLLSFVFQSNIVIINKLYCLALGLDMGLQYLYMVIPLIYLTEALPISINGWGVRESAFTILFVRAGTSNEEALAVALLVVAMRYLFSISVGGTLSLRLLLGKKQENRSHTG